MLKAVVARNADRVRAFADTWGYETAETDWRTVVERPDIDLVDIASPNDTHAEIAYARARLYLEAHRWPEAAAAFRAVALAHPDNDAAVYAAQLSLEALNVMASHGTPSCLDEMDGDLPRYVEASCSSAALKNVSPGRNITTNSGVASNCSQ